MNDSVVRVEGFAASLKGQRLWFCGPPSTLGSQILGRLSMLEEELLGRGRSVLIIQNDREISTRWTQKVQWHAIFRIKETLDLRLALNYIQNAAKPMRVVWIGDEPPMALLNALNHEVTFLAGSTTIPRGNWSAIFWHPSSEQKLIEEGIAPRIGAAGLQKMNLSSVLKELKAASVGLVWSSIGEASYGSVYWYDLEESTLPSQMTTADITEALREIADHLSHKSA